MISVVIPARDVDLRRLQVCVESYLRLPPEVVSEILIVDFGSRNSVEISFPDSRVKILRVESAEWSLSEAINVGVLSAKNDAVFKTDADIIVPKSGVIGLLSNLRDVADNEIDIALFRFRDLLPDCSVDDAAIAVQSDFALDGTLRPLWSQGAIAFSKLIWSRVGGYDSRLTGWGFEDNDFYDRCRRAGGRQRWVPVDETCLAHVWHPPSQFHPSVARQRDSIPDVVRRDTSILRPMRLRHVSGLTAPAIAALPPHVSIAIATSDRPGRDRMMLECIRSFIGQIGNDFEVDVLDNGSSEQATLSLQSELRRLQSQIKIRFWHEDYRSIPKARNQLAHEARGRFTAIMDDDDLSFPGRLADHLRSFDVNSRVHGSHGGWIDFDELTGVTEFMPGKKRTIETMFFGTGKILAHSACMYRTDVLKKMPYDELFDLGSDWDLATRMALQGLTMVHTKSYVTLRRFHGNNVTLTASSPQFVAGRNARSRATTTLSGPARLRLASSVKALDTEVVCLNAPTMAELLAMLPREAGHWHLSFPAAAIQSSFVDAERLSQTFNDMELRPECLRSGLGAEVVLITPPIAGAANALAKAEAVATAVGIEAAFISARQLELNSLVAFDWRTLEVGAGEVVLVSSAYRELELLLDDMNEVPHGSLLRAGLRLVADSDDTGRCYYIVGPKGPPSDEMSAYRRQLRKYGIDMDFTHSAGPSRRFASASVEAMR